MPLSSGTRVGSYEVLQAVGKGGMGEVYRARDTKLNRHVALKFLPDAFVLDVERLARFKREAQVLASLNHPNIAAIYGFEESGDLKTLVLEFVDGLTLAERVAQGSIPLDEALPIARQIAEALEAAHEIGIIHRDLKPANIKVRPDGTVKVLDFGLAKAVSSDPGPAKAGHYGQAGTSADNRSVRLQPDLSASPTITTPAMTQIGVILGTAAYMSPEQAKGRPADKRSDIWAFGCVLYEMLTGTRAFDGEDITDTIAAVVRATPDWSRLPAETPQRIRDLIRRCLEKDRKERLPHIGAARLEVKEALANLHVEASPADAPKVVGTTRDRSWRFAPLGAAVLLTAIVTGAVTWLLRPPAASQPVMRFNIPFGEQDTLTGIARQFIAISPDGTQIVYIANNRLYRRAIDDLLPHVIAGTERDVAMMGPVFSPDGQSLAYFGTSISETAIRRVPLSGGTPTTIVRTGNPVGMSWGEGGIVYSSGREILRVSPNGGTPERLVSLEEDKAAWGPQFLPGGDAVLFTLVRARRDVPFREWNEAQIVVHSLSSGERTVVVEEGSDARYLPSGHLLFAVSGSMFAVAFDPATRQTIGDRVAILSGVQRESIVGATQFSVSSNGSLVYIPGPVDATTTQLSLTISDRGSTTALKLPPRNYAYPRVSPDGARLAVSIGDDEEGDVWIYDLNETSAIRRLTIDGRSAYPVWSHDSQRVAFRSERDGQRGIFWQRADGQSVAERLTTASDDASHIPESFSGDGRYLLFAQRKAGEDYALYTLSLDDKAMAPFGNVTSSEPTGAAFSPDGRWVAYASTKRGMTLYSADRGVFVQPFPPTGAIFQVPKARIDYHPAWAPDGKSLFFVASAPRPLVVVNVQTQPSLTFGPHGELPRARPSLLSGRPRGYDVLPDGRILSVNPTLEEATGEGGRPEIRVVVNWSEELKRLVPTR